MCVFFSLSCARMVSRPQPSSPLFLSLSRARPELFSAGTSRTRAPQSRKRQNRKAWTWRLPAPLLPRSLPRPSARLARDQNISLHSRRHKTLPLAALARHERGGSCAMRHNEATWPRDAFGDAPCRVRARDSCSSPFFVGGLGLQGFSPSFRVWLLAPRPLTIGALAACLWVWRPWP